MVFRGFGGSDRLGTFYSGSDRLRTLILESLSTHDVGISVLIERSGEAYNGCKTRRWRRRRIDQRRSAL